MAHRTEAFLSRRWVGLSAVLLAAFMQLLDITVVNVAVPAIRSDLGAGYTEVQWVVAAYQLSFAVGLLTGGRLGDLFGRRRVFLAGVTAFAVTSLLCGLAPGPQTLIVARVAQGLAGAVMFPQVLSTVHTAFVGSERQVAFGLFGATVGLATITGPLIGGALVEWDVLGLAWRPVFLINLPVSLAALALGVSGLPRARAATARGLDLTGACLAGLCLFLVVFPLIQGREAGWPPWTWACFAAAGVLGRLFWWSQRRERPGGSDPLLDVGLLAVRSFRHGLLLSLVLYAGVAGFFFVLAVHLQAGFGFSPLRAGATLLAFAAGSTIASGAATALVPRLGRSVLGGGAALLVIGFALFVLVVDGHRDALTVWDLAPAFLVAGAGLGALLAPLSDIVLQDVEHGSAGAATGVLATAQQVGGALGVALIGVLFFGQVSAHARSASPAIEVAVQRDLVTAGLGGAAAASAASSFADCHRTRASAGDPAAVPAVCRTVLSAASPEQRQRVGPVLARAAEAARRQDFSSGMVRGGLYQVAVGALVLALVPLLPGRARYLGRHRAVVRT